MRVDLDGVDVTGPINLPNTGSWSVWQTVSTTANLTAGQHVLRIVFVAGNLNFNRINISDSSGTPTAATPTITPNGGSFTGSQVVTLATTTPGATIYYTTDGSTPTTGSTSYTATGPFTLNASATVRAFAVATGHLDSAAASATFTDSGGTPTAATPTITPNGGSFTGSQVVALATTTPGASDLLHDRRVDPDHRLDLLHGTGPFTLNASATVRAFAVATGYLDSAVASATFTGTAGGQPAYPSGLPWMVPGTIEAEDYDTGGQGIAYNDQTAGNKGRQYRTDDVDIWYSNNPPEGYYTGGQRHRRMAGVHGGCGRHRPVPA